MIKGKLLLGVLLALTSCATAGTMKNVTADVHVSEEDCQTIQPVEEERVCMFLYQARTYWDAVSEYMVNRQKNGLITDSELNDYSVQNREFSKYFDYALILYLRGDASSDLNRSLITIKQLLLNTIPCYPSVKRDITYVQAFKEDCVSVQPMTVDPQRLFLYKVKTSWDELCSHVFSGQFRTQESGTAVENFEALNKEFMKHYNSALLLFLSGDKRDDSLGKTLDILLDLLSKAKAYSPAE